jgi:hypothetical protein
MVAGLHRASPSAALDKRVFILFIYDFRDIIL